jgi:tRNA-dihydrouridine synthase
VQARRRLQESGCLAVMVGRGALIKPWIFEEFRLGRELLPTTEERVGEWAGLGWVWLGLGSLVLDIDGL